MKITNMYCTRCLRTQRFSDHPLGLRCPACRRLDILTEAMSEDDGEEGEGCLRGVRINCPSTPLLSRDLVKAGW